MNLAYSNQLFKMFPLDDYHFEELLRSVLYKEIPSGTVLLSEGEIATKLFIVVEGCLREYFITEDGREITFQFFVENEFVASFESATSGTPSRLYIQTIEDSVIGLVELKILEGIFRKGGFLNEGFNKFLMKRLGYYMRRCSSFVMDSPENRYRKLVEESPGLVERLPKQYIASYLGITPVSLSRIRSRIKKKAAEINNC